MNQVLAIRIMGSPAMYRFVSSIFWGAMAAMLGFSVYWYSMHLAGTRIYAVDECRNVFITYLLATGQMGDYRPEVSLILVPLMWLARDATGSLEVLATARLISLLIFWLNLLLLTLATGEKLFSRRGLMALVGAVTLAPFWDFGFEFSSDNLLVTGLLATWCAVRFGPVGFGAYLFAGALAVVMQFTSGAALVYTLPLTVALLMFPPATEIPRWKLFLAWLTGAGGMLLAISIGYGFSGVWRPFVAGLPSMWELSTGQSGEGAWKIIGRLMRQTPLLLALLFASLVALAIDIRHRGKAALGWSGMLPEALLFFLALGSLILYPIPQPQSLLKVVAFAFLLCYRYSCISLSGVWAVPLARPLVVAVLVFAHVVPFVVSTRRLLAWTNYRQEGFVRLAEQLTAPRSDPVYDGMGMVPTRSHISSQWFINSLNLRSSRHALRTLTDNPPAVVIRSYRSDQLPEVEAALIREWYVPLADDFWVLGKMLPPGGGSFQIIRPGRYQVTPKEASCILGTVERNPVGLVIPPVKTNCVGTVDGVPLTGNSVELTVGTHRLETASDCEPAVVWLGPSLNRLRPIADGHHSHLFVNWY
jgi:hypothetical protein